MKTIKRVLVFLLALITVVLIHYYLPQRDIVQVVKTDVKRMDISKGSPFWDRPDAGTEKQSTRDVRFIYTINEKDKTRVYRNEDTTSQWRSLQSEEKELEQISTLCLT